MFRATASINSCVGLLLVAVTLRLRLHACQAHDQIANRFVISNARYMASTANISVLVFPKSVTSPAVRAETEVNRAKSADVPDAKGRSTDNSKKPLCHDVL